MKGNNKSTPAIACWNTIGAWSRQKQKCEKLKEVLHCYNCQTYLDFAHSLHNNKLANDFTVPSRTAKSRSTHETQLSVLIFRVAGDWLAIPVNALIEVSEARKIHSLPHNQKTAVLGLTAIRGNLLTCINLFPLLHPIKTYRKQNDATSIADMTRLIVIGNANKRYVLYANEADKTDSLDISRLPNESNHQWPGFISCYTSIANRKIALLNPDILMRRFENNLP